METPAETGSNPVTFAQFPLPESLRRSLAKMNFMNPTPIQAQTMPLALKGRDIMGCAQTGTGKTGAFVIPTVARLADNPEMTALIMTPTRELALQILEVVKNMIWFEKNWVTALLIGGSAYGPQFQALRRRPRLIIGTPGRIQDHLDQKSLRLDQVGVLVLDEADRMLDMGFAPQIESILQGVSAERQTFLFTATLPHQIEKIAQRFMRNPERIMVGSNSKPIEKIQQQVVETIEERKLEVLLEQINTREGSVLIFTKTKYRTDRLSQELENGGYDVVSIHGDRSQRQRADAIRDFKKGHARILVATDVAARGLDVPHIAHVVNFDLPQVPEDFVHRIGRTARAGAEGHALTFVTPSERGMWKRIQRFISSSGQSGSGTGEGRRPAPRGGGFRRDAGPRGFGGPRRSFRNEDSRPERRDYGSPSERPQRREEYGSARPPRRDEGYAGARPPRREFADAGSRAPRGDRFESRPPRQDRFDEAPRFQRGDRPARGERPSFEGRPPRHRGPAEATSRPPRAPHAFAKFVKPSRSERFAK